MAAVDDARARTSAATQDRRNMVWFFVEEREASPKKEKMCESQQEKKTPHL
jgi:hypothetical protein